MSSTTQAARAGKVPLAILVCSELSSHTSHWQPVLNRLHATLPETPIETVAHLCERPLAAVPALRRIGARRALVAGCHNVEKGELQAAARLAGLDVYGIASVRVPLTGGPGLAERTVVAAARRLALQTDGEPTRLKLAPRKLSRRALLRLAPAVTAEPVAVVDTNRCLGLRRCGICQQSCPADAIDDMDGLAGVRGSACTSCGRCVSDCPTDAIHIAGATTDQITAQLTELLQEPPSVMTLACARARDLLARGPEEQPDDGAYVELPTLAMATPGWILQLLAHGVPVIRLIPCRGDCCAPWREGGSAYELCRHHLPAEIGTRITVTDGSAARGITRHALVQPPSVEPLRLDEPAATVSALRTLGRDVRTDHPGSALGLVELDEGCTLCTACTIACPTGALSSTRSGEIATLSFDPKLCHGCRLCVIACPENILRAQASLDTAQLATGKRELAQVDIRRCHNCQQELPAQPTIDRLRNALGAQSPALTNLQPNLCLACAASEQRLTQRDGLAPRP